MARVTRYMLDTNTISHLTKEHPAVARRVIATPMTFLCMSAITQGELLFGLAKRPEATRLHLAVRELLRRVDVQPWDSAAAEYYGTVRAAMARQGKVLAPLDLLIAAHALSFGVVLVTNDKAFGQVDALPIEDWSSDRAV
jgi:tRNA(fMet)-specific endonuclease VapC